MALTITLPDAGLLGIAGATATTLSEDATLEENTIYVLEGTNDHTITLPDTATVNDAAIIIVKNIDTATWTVASTRIERLDQTIEITNNQTIRFIFVSVALGWIIT